VSNKASFLKLIIIISLIVSANQLKSQVPDYVPIDSLAGWWSFDGNANDASANSNDGTVTGAILSTDRNGNSNSAYDFDGVDDHIIIPSDPSLSSDSISISCWIYPNSISSNFSSIIKKGNYTTADNEEYAFGLKSTNLIYSGIKDGTSCDPGFGWINDSFTSPITLINNWTHLVFSYANDSIYIYINGNIEQTVYINGSINFCGDEEITFGEEWLNHFPFDGKIDNIGIWNRKLTDSEILDVYHESLIPTINSSTISEIKCTSTRFNSIIDDGGSSSTISFEYGTSSNNYSTTVTADNSPLSANSGTTSIYKDITGLKSNTTYYFAAIATNARGSVTSSESTFTTEEEPTDHTSVFTANSIGISSVNFNIESLDGISAEGYIILYSQSLKIQKTKINQVQKSNMYHQKIRIKNSF